MLFSAGVSHVLTRFPGFILSMKSMAAIVVVVVVFVVFFVAGNCSIGFYPRLYGFRPHYRVVPF